MRIKTDKNYSKVILFAAALSVTALASVAWWCFLHKSSDTSIDSNTDTSIVADPAPSKLSEKDAAAKQEFIEKQHDQSTNTTDDTSTPSDTPKPSGDVSISATQEGSSVTIVSKITGIGDGTCALAITNNSRSYHKEASVIYQPNYSSCAGFSVPTSELGKGTWNIELTVNSVDGFSAKAMSSVEVS